MKKSVVILIALIYIASVVLVSFFGLQFKVFEEVIPVERVEITNQGLKYSETWGDYVVITPNDKGELRYQIDYHVYPDNATENGVTYSFDASPEGCATIDEYGLVTFSKAGMIKVRVIAADGSNAEDTITIIAVVQ